MKLIHNNHNYGHIVFKAQVGSHAYGTNVEGSDEDFAGIFFQSPDSVLERGYQETIQLSKDEVYVEIRKFLELCCGNNPTMLCLLYSPEDCIIYKHPIMDKVLENKEKFLSKGSRHSFGGYAISQINKASGLCKKMNWSDEEVKRKTVMDFCYVVVPGRKGIFTLQQFFDDNALTQNQCLITKLLHTKEGHQLFISNKPTKGIAVDNSDNLRLSEVPKEAIPVATLLYSADSYSAHCKKYKEYESWLKNRNVQRYVDVETHGQTDKEGGKIDGKNLLHTYRLLTMGKEIAEGKGLIVRRPDAEFLKSIRQGKLSLSELLEKATTVLDEMNVLFNKSDLPDKADRSFFMSLLPKLRKEFYYSHIQK